MNSSSLMSNPRSSMLKYSSFLDNRTWNLLFLMNGLKAKLIFEITTIVH